MQHGTILSDNDAPSYFGSGSEAYSFGSVFASQGYIIAAPDYIGYGASKELPHTYEHRNGLATASLDMLRAARDFLADQKALNGINACSLPGTRKVVMLRMSLQKENRGRNGQRV